jgi:hypothetical protein
VLAAGQLWEYTPQNMQLANRCPPSKDLRSLFHTNSQSRSVGQSTEGSKRAMLVVTQRSLPGVLQVKVKGTCGRAMLDQQLLMCCHACTVLQ